MFIKKTTKRSGGKTYVNHLLVESVLTPKGPRHKVVCSLGPLAPAEPADWLALAHKLEAALAGRQSIQPDPTLESLVAKAKPRMHESPRAPAPALVPQPQPATEVATVHVDCISPQDARQAGPEVDP